MKELVYHRQLLPAVEQFADKVALSTARTRTPFAGHGDRVLRLAHAMRHSWGSAATTASPSWR